MSCHYQPGLCHGHLTGRYSKAARKSVREEIFDAMEYVDSKVRSKIQTICQHRHHRPPPDLPVETQPDQGREKSKSVESSWRVLRLSKLDVDQKLFYCQIAQFDLVFRIQLDAPRQVVETAYGGISMCIPYSCSLLSPIPLLAVII